MCDMYTNKHTTTAQNKANNKQTNAHLAGDSSSSVVAVLGFIRPREVLRSNQSEQGSVAIHLWPVPWALVSAVEHVGGDKKQHAPRTTSKWRGWSGMGTKCNMVRWFSSPPSL